MGLVDPSGQVRRAVELPTAQHADQLDAFLSGLISNIHSLLGQAEGEVVGIGLTFLGWIDEAKTGPYLCMNLPFFHGVNLKQIFEAEFDLPVALNDDVSAHTLAEYTYGCGQGTRRFMCLAMGTGLAAGVIINGAPLSFTGGCAGDTGHLILRPEAEVYCSAGCRGCAEALIGTAGIERLALEKYGSRVPAAQVIRSASQRSDPRAVQVMQQIGLYTGELLASLSHIFLPEVICLAGGTSRAEAVLLRAAQERFEELVGEYHRNYSHLSAGYYRGVEIVLAGLSGETGVIGSVIELFKRLGIPIEAQKDNPRRQPNESSVSVL